jgi:hypothetical protein
MNGIHPVNVDFCGCTQHDGSQPVEKQIQLLEAAWWPATCLEPQSKVSFAVLKQFQFLNLHESLVALEYYCTLEDLTSDDGLTGWEGKH